MKERPILFSTPMVRATLEGRKTQTRRLVKIKETFAPGDWRCRFGQQGDVLWVRETWGKLNGEIYYKADNTTALNNWKPSIHILKSDSRIWLEIINLRLEPIQNISWDDAVAEGCRGYRLEQFEPTDDFKQLWIKLHGEALWDMNPWVWVIEFKVLSTNGKPKEINVHSEGVV